MVQVYAYPCLEEETQLESLAEYSGYNVSHHQLCSAEVAAKLVSNPTQNIMYSTPQEQTVIISTLATALTLQSVPFPLCISAAWCTNKGASGGSPHSNTGTCLHLVKISQVIQPSP